MVVEAANMLPSHPLGLESADCRSDCFDNYVCISRRRGSCCILKNALHLQLGLTVRVRAFSVVLREPLFSLA